MLKKEIVYFFGRPFQTAVPCVITFWPIQAPFFILLVAHELTPQWIPTTVNTSEYQHSCSSNNLCSAVEGQINFHHYLGWLVGNVVFEHHATENMSHSSLSSVQRWLFRFFARHGPVNPDQPSAPLIPTCVQSTNLLTTLANAITSVAGWICIKQCLKIRKAHLVPLYNVHIRQSCSYTY